MGRLFLQAIVFDMDFHLRSVENFVHDKNVDEISSANLKVTSSHYKGLIYGAVEDDQIELPETAGATIGEDSEDEMQDAFNKIIQDAEENVMSSDGVDRLRKMLNDYRDVFRIRLVPDQLARVSPLLITPAKNSSPFRSPQRRYGLAEKAFISSTIRKLESIGAIY